MINAQHISSILNMDNTDSIMAIGEQQGQGVTEVLSFSTLMARPSVALKKFVLTQLVILGGFSIGGTIKPNEELVKVYRWFTMPEQVRFRFCQRQRNG